MLRTGFRIRCGMTEGAARAQPRLRNLPALPRRGEASMVCCLLDSCLRRKEGVVSCRPAPGSNQEWPRAPLPAA
jgi:hypothetical protein